MKIGAIVVLYNCNYNESKTISSIINNLRQIDREDFNNFKLIIFDNGILDQSSYIKIDFDYEYYWNGKNNGLAFAYNFAFQKYKLLSYDWILLLDQDTSFSVNYLNSLFQNVRRFSKRDDIVIFAPKMLYNGKLFSPSTVKLGGIHRPLKFTNNETSIHKNIFAVGSATLVKIDFIEKLNGFNDIFPIDCLDRWLYLMANKLGFYICIINCDVHHELSILDKHNFVSLNRYSQILAAENRFIKMYKSPIDMLIFYLRLTYRAVRFLFQKSRIKYFNIILKFLLKINVE